MQFIVTLPEREQERETERGEKGESRKRKRGSNSILPGHREAAARAFPLAAPSESAALSLAIYEKLNDRRLCIRADKKREK